MIELDLKKQGRESMVGHEGGDADRGSPGGGETGGSHLVGSCLDTQQSVRRLFIATFFFLKEQEVGKNLNVSSIRDQLNKLGSTQKNF